MIGDEGEVGLHPNELLCRHSLLADKMHAVSYSLIKQKLSLWDISTRQTVSSGAKTATPHKIHGDVYPHAVVQPLAYHHL